MKFSFAKVASVLAVVSGAIAGPIVDRRDASLNTSVINPISFNEWQGLKSLSGFDDFFGVGNFNGLKNQRLVLGDHQNQLQCRQQQAGAVQQQLAVLQEFAKMIVLTQVCDVQAQILFLEQFRGGLRDFRLDIQRVSGREIGFDRNVFNQFDRILKANSGLFDRNQFDLNKFNVLDLGFRGNDIGKNFVTPRGSVWNDDVNRSVQDLLKLIASQSRN